MRAYAVSANELYLIAGLGFVASIFFAISTSCLQMYFDIYRDITLTPVTDPEMLGRWDTWKTILLWGSIVFGAVGLAVGIFDGITIHGIKKRAKFDEDAS